MSLWYRVLYSLGITPWESDSEPLADQIGDLVSREEAGEQPSGPALDLGCGTGRWSVLARRGWDVVGVDLVPKAVRGARQRAQEAGADVQFPAGVSSGDARVPKASLSPRPTGVAQH